MLRTPRDAPSAGVYPEKTHSEKSRTSTAPGEPTGHCRRSAFAPLALQILRGFLVLPVTTRTQQDLSRFDPETKVSRRHARIWLEGETFLVEDLGSVNGTVINDSVRLAPRQPRVLDSGDKLRVGETTLHFLVG